MFRLGVGANRLTRRYPIATDTDEAVSYPRRGVFCYES